MNRTTCPTCNGTNLYYTRTIANGGYGPTLLPKLGGFFRPAEMDIVVCADCGLTRFFAAERERAQLTQSSKWTRLPQSGS